MFCFSNFGGKCPGCCPGAMCFWAFSPCLYAYCLAKIVQGECNEVYFNCRTIANLMQRYALTMNKCLDTNEKNARQSKKIIER